MRVTRLRPILALLAGAWLLAGGAVGAAAEEAGWGYELSNELMSPYCPGRALAECPSPQAEDMRQWILDQEKAGVAREEVEAELYRQFGDQLRQAPRAEGVGLLAYALPAVLFLGGGAVVGVFIRRQRGGETPVAEEPAPLQAVDPELERELEAELGKDA